MKCQLWASRTDDSQSRPAPKGETVIRNVSAADLLKQAVAEYIWWVRTQIVGYHGMNLGPKA